MKRIYIIKELWLDPMENRDFNAMWYHQLGFTSDEQLVEQIKRQSPVINKSNCWAMARDMPRFITVPLDEMTVESEPLSWLKPSEPDVVMVTTNEQYTKLMGRPAPRMFGCEAKVERAK